MTDRAKLPKPREVKIRVHDGAEIAVALYMPEGSGPFPVLLAASPYRYDNNDLPASPQFLWRETGPIDFYLKHGYEQVATVPDFYADGDSLVIFRKRLR